MRTNCGCSRRRTPSSTGAPGHCRRSFSSALLEATYRSMDEEYGAVPPAGSPTTRGPGERAPSAAANRSARSTPSLFFPFPDLQVSLLPPTTSKPVPAAGMPGRKPRKSQRCYSNNCETMTEGKLLSGQSAVSPSARLASLLIKLLPAARHRKKAKNPADTGSDHSGAKTLRRGRDAAKGYVCSYPVVGEGTPAAALAGARVVKGPPRAGAPLKRARAGGKARELVRRFTARKGVGERKLVAGDDGRSSCPSSSELFELDSLGEPAAVLLGGGDRLFR